MMTFIITLLKDHAAGSLLCALGAFIAAMLLTQHIEIVHLRGKVVTCANESFALASSNKALLASLENQNEAVSGLEEQAKEKTDKAEKALLIARRDTEKYAAQARQIEAQKITGNACADMRKLVDEYVKNAP